MMKCFPEVKQKLGFGFMRLPETDGEIDIAQTQKMVDLFLENGFNYFDTAHGYINGKSEGAIKECITSKYPRESYVLADKLSCDFFEKKEDIKPLFFSQLENCGVEYFDFYLMHAQNKELYKKYKECDAYNISLELKKEGRIKHLGISFHDTADVLDEILCENPEIEFVQIQFNYIDYESESVQSRKVYEVCKKHKKPVIIMEPVKGGILAKIPDAAKEVFGELGGSPASYALRFAAGFEGVFMVLSGMSNLDMIEENVKLFKNLKPLNIEEAEAVQKVCSIIKKQDVIACTSCNYCTEGCPEEIPISKLFSCYNIKKTFSNWNADYYYDVHTADGHKASSCVRCGACESACPQHLKIRDLLLMVKEEFEK